MFKSFQMKVLQVQGELWVFSSGWNNYFDTLNVDFDALNVNLRILVSKMRTML